MKNFKRFLLLLTVLTAAVLLFAGCGEVLESSVTVMVAEGEGYTVVGENPRKVPAGESVSFQLELADGWMLINPDGTISETGTITVDRVLYPDTIVPDVRDWVHYCTFQLKDPTVRGTMTSTTAPGEVISGTVITVTAQPYEGYTFVGWTGENKKVIVSKEAEYTFTLEKDTILYPSYLSAAQAEAKANTALLVYNANGGICTLDNQEDGLYYEEVDVSQFKLPNCMGGLGQFVRDGYHLVEYNTKPDGTGDPYSLGSKIILDTGLVKKDTEILYCIWKKETDASAFTYTEKNGELTITGYKGDHKEVVIPTHIGGKPVTKLAAGAFTKSSFTLLSLPDTLITVENGALNGCANLTTIYFPDSVINITDKAIQNCPNWQHFYLNAVTPPRYGPGMLTKTEALITTQDRNRVVVLSGSSSLHSIDSIQLMEALDNQYYVVNHGTNAGCSAAVYLEVFKNFMHEGDILVQAPEYSNEQLGSMAVPWKTYRECEMFYNIFRYLDARDYTFFAGYAEHQKTRQPMKATSYNIHNRSYNEHGDITSTGKRDELNSPNYTSNFNISYNTSILTDVRAAALNKRYDALREVGVTVYISFAPHNYNGLTKQAREPAHKTAFTQHVAKMLNSPVISDLNDYTLEGQYFWDSDWHTNNIGRTMRTEQLGKDLRAQLVKDGIFTK